MLRQNNMLQYKNNSPKRFRRQARYFKYLIWLYKIHLCMLRNLQYILDYWQLNDPFLEANIHGDKEIIGLLYKDLKATKDILSKL